MNVENTKLSETSQREGHDLIYMRFAESANSRTESRAEVTRGWGQGREACEPLPNSCKGLFGVMKTVGLGSGDAYTSHSVPWGKCTLQNSSNGSFHI